MAAKFFSCYESIKLMDKQTFLVFPDFSPSYKLEEDMQILTQNNNKAILKEFLWIIKLIRIKQFQVNYEKLLYFLFDNLSYHEGDTSFIECFDLYKKAIKMTIKALIKKKGPILDLDSTLSTGEKLITFLSRVIIEKQEQNLQNELQNFLWIFVSKELIYDEVSFFKYLSTSNSPEPNFCSFIALILYLLNEISLSQSKKLTLNSNYYRGYRTFLLNLQRYFQKHLLKLPFLWNILTIIMSYMMKEARNGWIKVDNENTIAFIESAIEIFADNLGFLRENFIKQEKEIFSYFVTFLKLTRNKDDSLMKTANFKDSLFKLVKILKCLVPTDTILEPEIQNKIRGVLEFLFSFENQIYLIQYCLEDACLINFSFTLDLLLTNKIWIVQNLKNPIATTSIPFFQVQNSFENILRILTPEFLADEQIKNCFLQMALRTQFNLSKENFKGNSSSWRILTSKIDKLWNEPKGHRLILHLMIDIPKELYFEEGSFIVTFRHSFDSLVADLNETYEFLKFQLKNLNFLVKNPEIYSIFIEKVTNILIDLVLHPEISQDEANMVLYQAKFAEFFNCGFFFVAFPLVLQKRKRFPIAKSSDSNTKDFLIFTPFYCVCCGQKLSNLNRIFSMKKRFNVIICKQCDYAMSAYYCSENVFWGSEGEIDSYLIELSEEKSTEIRNCLIEKIKEEAQFLNGETRHLYLDCFFRDSKNVLVLILSNIIKDLMVYQ